MQNDIIIKKQQIFDENRKDFGLFFTPEWVVDFMVNLVPEEIFLRNEPITILEPACGLAQFLLKILHKIKEKNLNVKTRLIGVEINEEVLAWLNPLKPKETEIIKADFLLFEPKIFFDLVIGNPPYGIPSLSEHYTIKVDNETKEKYRALFSTWYGKYNIYGAFIEKSIRLLKDNGILIFIIPATFMLLDEFKKLRTFLSQNGKTTIIYMGPDIFKPDADVSTVILKFIKSEKISRQLELFEYKEGEIIPIKSNKNWNGEIVTFRTDFSDFLESICQYKVADIYEIKISPRTSEIKNCSFVVRGDEPPAGNYLPILNSRNLKSGGIIYENLTGYWVAKSNIKKLRAYFGSPHIVVGLGFRENGRIAAAIDEKCYPWMGDVYHLLRRNDLLIQEFDLSDDEVVEYLNSEYVKRYIKDIYREITYHLSITQVKNIPLPNKKEWEEIKKYGYK